MREIAIVLACLLRSLYALRVNHLGEQALSENLLALSAPFTSAKLRGRGPIVRHPVATPPCSYCRRREIAMLSLPNPRSNALRLWKQFSTWTRKRRQQGYEDKVEKVLKLKERKKAAAGVENYAEAARLRDKINEIENEIADQPQEARAMLELLEAHKAFYNCFAKRDIEQMAELWANEEHDDGTAGLNWPKCSHPYLKPMQGYDTIVKSWRDILEDKNVQDIVAMSDVQCKVLPGGQSGLITCTQQIGGNEFTVTNVFTKGYDGKWRLVLHHAGQLTDVFQL